MIYYGLNLLKCLKTCCFSRGKERGSHRPFLFLVELLDPLLSFVIARALRNARGDPL
jgi:hypothetical protein